MLIVGASGLGVVTNAVLQGTQKFFFFALMTILSVASKIIICLILVKIGLGVLGALSGVLLSSVFIWVTNCLYIQRSYRTTKIRKNSSIEDWYSFKRFLPVLFANVAFLSMTQLDLVIVNSMFDPLTASSYAAAAVLGKAVLYLPGGVVLALFPIVAANHAASLSTFKLFNLAAIGTLLGCSLLALFYFCFSSLIIEMFYGEKFRFAADVLKWYGFAILPMSMVMVAEHFLIAKGRMLFAWLLTIIAPIQIAWIVFFETSVTGVVAVVGITGMFVWVFGYAVVFHTESYGRDEN